MDPKTKQLVEYVEKYYTTDSDIDRPSEDGFLALCSAVREQEKRARHAEAERDTFGERIKDLETQLTSRKPTPARKDIALALLRGIGPNPAEFMAAGKDAFFGLADQIIAMFSDSPSPK